MLRSAFTILALAVGLATQSSAQTVRYRDFFVSGTVTIIDLGQGPRVVVSGTGAARDFAGYWQGLTASIVGVEFGQVWVYDGNACRTGHVYAVHNSHGWAERGYIVDNPMTWGPLRRTTIPGGVWQQRGGYTTYSLSVCREWPANLRQGVGACPNGFPDGCIVGSDGAQFWAVVLSITG